MANPVARMLLTRSGHAGVEVRVDTRHKIVRIKKGGASYKRREKYGRQDMERHA